MPLFYKYPFLDEILLKPDIIRFSLSYHANSVSDYANVFGVILKLMKVWRLCCATVMCDHGVLAWTRVPRISGGCANLHHQWSACQQVQDSVAHAP